MKILDVRWFNGVGIVRVEDEYEGIKYYIKDTYFSKGRTEREDTQFVADCGSTFPNDAGDVLFGVKR
jgi:hypothetical protein